jgi:hydrogenase-4 component F
MAGFAFVLAGYGTKMGLSPFHTWLPDAHSEAPAPVSALLSGALLNCSFFGIVRFREIMPQAASPFCDNAMLVLGIVSVATGAVFMVRQADFKRLLAYSSVEHMGLVIIMFSLFSSASDNKVLGYIRIALMFHIVAHSIIKTVLFQTAGNLLLAFRTRAVSVVQGLGVSMKGHATLWLTGLVLICGMPPSPLFLSELFLVLCAPIWLSVTILILLFIVFAAMMKVCLSMTMGRPIASFKKIPKRLTVVPAIFLSVLIIIGVFALYGAIMA